MAVSYSAQTNRPRVASERIPIYASCDALPGGKFSDLVAYTRTVKAGPADSGNQKIDGIVGMRRKIVRTISKSGCEFFFEIARPGIAAPQQ